VKWAIEMGLVLHNEEMIDIGSMALGIGVNCMQYISDLLM
jgi:hypothetical protein